MVYCFNAVGCEDYGDEKRSNGQRESLQVESLLDLLTLWPCIRQLIESSLARNYLEDRVVPRETVKAGALGFVMYDPEARMVTNRRPTAAERARVLERDGYRCQLCGERPSLNEHIVLHVHHIRPFSKGGLTTEQNLITLCQTCQGLL
jgi:hypothetical protein